MTVMFPQFFGVPHAAIRLGIMRKLSGVAFRIYIALCHESERCRSRELKRTVPELQKLVGGSPNSHAKARRQLARAGLVEFKEMGAEGILFRLCDPITGKPWPGDAKTRVPYHKKGSIQGSSGGGAAAAAPSSEPPATDWRRSSTHTATQVAGKTPEQSNDSAAIPPGLESPWHWNNIGGRAS